MLSSIDKTILGSVGAALTVLTASAASYAWSMMNSDAGGSPPVAPPVATLSQIDGLVKTRQREVLAWSDAARTQELREGDRVRTLSASRAEIRYDHGVAVLLDPNAQVTVYGPVSTSGQRLVAVHVFDGTIQAEVAAGETLAVRDATGAEQGRVRAIGGRSAKVRLTAAPKADGLISLEVIEGEGVEIEVDDDDGDGEPSTLRQVAKGAVQRLGRDLIRPTPTPTPEATAAPTRLALATPPVRVPLLKGAPALPLARSDSTDTRFRLPLPKGVVSVEIQGRKQRLIGNQVEVQFFGLSTGMNEVDLIYTHRDGSKSRQVQRIRVR